MIDPDKLNIDTLSAADWDLLEDWHFERLLEQATARMALAQAEMRSAAGKYHAYLAAKDDFSRYRQIGSHLQTLSRVKRG